MATHSSVLAWRIPGTGHPGGVSQSQTRVKKLSSSSQKHTVPKGSVTRKQWAYLKHMLFYLGILFQILKLKF